MGWLGSQSAASASSFLRTPLHCFHGSCLTHSHQGPDFSHPHLHLLQGLDSQGKSLDEFFKHLVRRVGSVMFLFLASWHPWAPQAPSAVIIKCHCMPCPIPSPFRKDRVLKMDSSYLDVFFKSAFVVYAPVCTYRFMYVDGGMCLTVVPVFRQVPLFLVVLVFPRTGSPLSQAAPPCRPNTSGVHLGTTPHLTWLEGTQNAALLHARQLCKCRRAPPRPPRGGGILQEGRACKQVRI